MKKCAILTMDTLDDFEAYDHLIEDPLKELGWSVEMISWRAESIDWNSYQAVIIRSPWDYQDDAPAFLQVLKTIYDSSAHLENSLAIVEWNIDKIYLKALEQKGVTLVPTLWQEKLSNETLSTEDINQYFNHFNQQQIVLKPRISANADNTFWLNKDSYQEKITVLNDAFNNRDFMVQPFMEHIVEEGEFSLFYFNGHYSHTILKIPKGDDFRVQEEHGGQLKTIEPEATLIQHAEQVMTALADIHQTPLYARVDFVRHGEGFALMEAELIEPSLYFNMDKASPKRFAQAFVERMNKLSL
jgi:hypothetical protein